MTLIYAAVVGVLLGVSSNTSLWSLPLAAVALVAYDVLFGSAGYRATKEQGGSVGGYFARIAPLYLVIVAVGYGVAALVRSMMA